MMSQPINQLITPQRSVEPTEAEQPDGTQLPVSFVGTSGRFYIRQPRANGSGHSHRLTVWPSETDYNHRTPVPLAFCDAADAVADFSHEVRIYPESLTTTPPPYPIDRDETDLGLTPKREAWKERFIKTTRRYAA